jgi:serine/threonine protein kinase
VSAPPSAKPKTLRDGRYTLNRTIGTGSQAETYEARDNGVLRAPGRLVDEWQRYVTRARRGETPNAQALVAIKCFHVGKAKAWKDVELAEREASTLASLTHPNLPRYIEHFEEEGALYLVMEMVEGESLAALRARQRVSSVAEVTRMLHDIAAALRYLHGRAPAVVHRDIKPGNIIRRHDGSYALVDFGAVRDRLKPEGGSTVVGTFGYMAPEQFQGRASPKSDLYGLAATALVMLTGCEPEDLPHVGLGIDVGKALPSSTPAPLVRALTSMLNPDPDRRASSIDEALAFLRDAPEAPLRTAPQPRESWPPTNLPELKKQRKREARAEKRRRRAAARAKRAPFVPRVVGQLALLVALLAVWVSVGLAVPLVLMILSLVFGGALRRAALATRRAASRSQASLRRGSAWLAGYRIEDAAPSPRLRVGPVGEHVRIGEGGERPIEGRSIEEDEESAANATEIGRRRQKN